MGSPVIEIDQVSKRFKLYADKPKSLKERIITLGRQTHEDFWALRDVTLDVNEGETVGLLGHNGSVPLDLRDQRLAAHVRQIVVHGTLPG